MDGFVGRRIMIFSKPWHNLKTLLRSCAAKILDYLVYKAYGLSPVWHRWYQTFLTELAEGRLTEETLCRLVNASYTVERVRSLWWDKILADTLTDPLVGTQNLETREVWLEKTLADLPTNWRILDAGAGELKYKTFCPHLQYVSQDFGQYNGQGNAEGLQMGNWDNSKLDIVSDITDIPVPDASFDAIMCVEVFEHLPEPVRAVAEFARLLRPGGVLILTAPFCSLTHFAPYYFANGYSRYWYEKVLSEHGFIIEEIQPNGNYFEYLAQELRRLPEIAKNWAQTELSIKESIGWSTMLNLLAEGSLHDSGSSQLLHFGYQVRACKSAT
jgi:ubiquinone/menaquinone biosynthesis C-methylase UbiE